MQFNVLGKIQYGRQTKVARDMKTLLLLGYLCSKLFCTEAKWKGLLFSSELTNCASLPYILQADGFDAVARVAVPADHRGIIYDRHVFRILQHWLNAGEPDPFYNPLNDYVVLPTAFEFEKHTEKSMQVTTVKEDWEIISSADANEKRPGDLPAMVGSVSVSSGGDNERAQATVVVHPQSHVRQHVEVMAVSVTM